MLQKNEKIKAVIKKNTYLFIFFFDNNNKSLKNINVQIRDKKFIVYKAI